VEGKRGFRKVPCLGEGVGKRATVAGASFFPVGGDPGKGGPRKRASQGVQSVAGSQKMTGQLDSTALPNGPWSFKMEETGAPIRRLRPVRTMILDGSLKNIAFTSGAEIRKTSTRRLKKASLSGSLRAVKQASFQSLL